MNLSQLASVSGISSRLSQSRADTANKLCEQGFILLSDLFKESIRHDFKQHFMETFDLFSKALSAQRSHPEPYIGLAYLLALVEDYPRAMAYTKAAQRLAPNHDDIDVLLSYIVAKTSAKAKGNSAPQPLSGAVSNIDYDALYDRVELRLKMELQRLQQFIMPVPSGKLKHHQLLDSQLKILKAFNDEVQEELRILDEEFDISELSGYIRQIMQYMQRYRHALSISDGLILLHTNLEAEEKYIEQLAAQIDMLSIDELDQALEKTLDRVDKLADQLDSWEGKGIVLSDLIQRYEMLTREVESLQDQLDERRDLVAA